MAKQLYDYWFVQFDFPNEECKPYKSSGGAMVYNERLKKEVPIDWKVENLIDFAEIKNGATPSTTDEANYGGDIVWITPKDLSDQQSKFVYQGERNITKQGFDSCSTSMLPTNSVLMSSRAPIGLVSIAKHEVCTNQGFKSFIPKSISDSIYLYYYIKHHIKQIEQLGTGTTFKEVSRDDLCKFPILTIGAKDIYVQGGGLTSIKNMRSFYLMFSKLQIGQAMLDQFKLTDEPIRQAPLDESTIPFYPNLSWLHYERLLRVKDADARLWYLKEAAREQWDYRTLQRNISSQYYYRLLQTPEHLRKEVSDEMRSLTSDFEKDKLSYLKNPVIAEFLGLPQNPAYSESKLETAIIDHLQTFIMELGKGYAFVARQQHIKTDMGDFYIDLVFYNIILKSYLIIDLKTTQITHQDVGQMDMYVRMYDELKKEEGNNPTIGLVLCSDTSKDLARYSILKDSKQLFAAKYLTYLPTEEELSREIREQKEFFELQKGKEAEDED